MRILLASQSPRRAALLREAGIEFDPMTEPLEVDESFPFFESPGRIVEIIATRKAQAGAAQEPGRVALGADTLVFLDGTPMGKPGDAAHAGEMLRALSGRWHDVLTGVALADDSPRVLVGHRWARVRVTDLFPAEIKGYVETGEPLDKAGGYGIQGMGASFAFCSAEDRDTVVGLPIDLVQDLIRGWGR